MKTVIFNGSPRKNGDTSFLIEKFKDSLLGETKIVRTYCSEIRPCADCRYCWKTVGCCIDDEMQPIYEELKVADCIIIASPLYFSELSGSLLNVLSRLQTFYASKRFLNMQQLEKPKVGALILCGGGDGDFRKAEETAQTLFNFMNAKKCGTIYSLNTDTLPSKDDVEAIRQIESLAKYINDSFSE
jgi:Multimeric flavodoxin WrbA